MCWSVCILGRIRDFKFNVDVKGFGCKEARLSGFRVRYHGRVR